MWRGRRVVGSSCGCIPPAHTCPTTPHRLLPACSCCSEFDQIRELSLSGNQLRSDMQQRRLRFQPGDSLSNDSAAESAAAGTAAAAGGTAAAPVTAAASGGALGGGASGAEDAAELAKLRAGAEIFDCSSERAGAGVGGARLGALSSTFASSLCCTARRSLSCCHAAGCWLACCSWQPACLWLPQRRAAVEPNSHGTAHRPVSLRPVVAAAPCPWPQAGAATPSCWSPWPRWRSAPLS